MKRRTVSVLITAAVTASLFGGCSIYMPELSVSDFDKVAEYAAYALLGDADDYESKLISEEEVARLLEERALKEKIEQEMAALNDPNKKPDEPTTEPGEEGDKVEIDVPEQVGKVLDIPNIEIQYAGHSFTERYPDSADAVLSLQATKGNQFMVLSFVLQNNTDAAAECDILSRDIVYTLKVNEKDSYRSQLTMLDGDLSTWNTPIESGSINIAVLIFQVPDELNDADITKLELMLRENKLTETIVLE
ncbi:MAG: hypothetical protein IJW18_07245 [Lachnospiraceae bacterium]|nr:hypothetical protein [Lachnospiraceae bacterium]MBQ9765977.1 hypothetical protein [Lachnospiraceae bacterium]